MTAGNLDNVAAKHLAHYESAVERERIGSLLGLLPEGVESLLDIGAREGYITQRLAGCVPEVTALDLERPAIDHPRIRCVKGNAARLDFPDNHFDLVFCAEVLEHIPEPSMTQACREIARVAKRFVLIGVPHRQDIRQGRVTCRACHRISPPWGHVNSFDEPRLTALFRPLQVVRQELIGRAEHGTNSLSTWLLDRAGNPYGTYIQDEPCGHCGARFSAPPSERSLVQRVETRLAVRLRDLQGPWSRRSARWMHILFEKTTEMI